MCDQEFIGGNIMIFKPGVFIIEVVLPRPA